MEKRSAIVDTLKKALRSKGVTYAALAQELKLSEASVKRIFSAETFTLTRLEQILSVLDLSFAQLGKLADEGEPKEALVLSESQEKELAENSDLLSLFYLLLAGNSVSYIEKNYSLGQKLESYLLKLDRLDLIQYGPQGKIKLRVTRQVRWKPLGPLMKKYGEGLKKDFFSRAFNGENEIVRFIPGKLSPNSMRIIENKLKRLIQEYHHLVEFDEDPSNPSHKDVALLLGFRAWNFELLEQRKKRKKD